MADYQLRARIPNELAESVKEIAEELNLSIPEAEVTISTIARYALKEYARKYYHDQLLGLTMEIETQKLDLDTAVELYKHIEAISKIVSEESVELSKKRLKGTIEYLIADKSIKEKFGEKGISLD